MRAIPYLAFFCSGASSLIFQTIWARLLHHTFGATSVAVSTVLTAFMAGLGLGAYLLGKRAARFRRPLRVYAACELGVALCALVLPPLVESDGPLSLVNAALRAQFGAGSGTFAIARFLCVAPLLLVPTTLMGGTLPLLSAHFVSDAAHGETESRVGALYALNTLGAVAGTLLGSFVLMPRLGVAATNGIAAALNVALALAVLAVRSAPAAAHVPVRNEQRPERTQSATGAARLALLAFGVSGACAMAYEVVWSRALAMALGSSLQSFALILATFLSGIAGGSALSARLARTDAGRGLPLLAIVSVALSAIALAPAMVLSSAAGALAVLALVAAGLALFVALTLARTRALAALLDELPDEALVGDSTRVRERAGLLCLAVPCAIALIEAARFYLSAPAERAVGTHGYLPYVSAAAVLASALTITSIAAVRDARAGTLSLAGVQLAIGVATLASHACQDEIPYGFARLVGALDDLPEQVGTVRLFMMLTAGLCSLPAALGMGAMFPRTLALVRTRARGDVADDVGRVYAINTLGSIVGAWLPGFVLLPRWGMERTLALGMALNGALALLLALSARPARPLRSLIALASLGLLTVLALSQTLPSWPLAWDLSHMTLGAFRVSLARDVLNPSAWGKPELLYYRDGVATTVSVERWGRHLSLKNNGKVDASNGDDMPTQVMVAAYPLLFHARGPRDLNVAIVGFGSGVTVGATLGFPVRHVDAVELEGGVVEAATRFFADASGLDARAVHARDGRLRVHEDDGRNFLAATEARYDVIVSEPSNPWITGVSDLFTVEHFRTSKRALKPGGVYCQWVQLYELSPENIKTVYRTFASEFRYVVAFSAEELSSDTILVGSDDPLPLDVAHVARAFEQDGVARQLARAYVHTPYDVFSRMLFGARSEILAFAQREQRMEDGVLREVVRATGAATCASPGCRREPVSLNTDDNMRIELAAPSDLIGFARYDGYLALFYGDDWPYGRPDALAGLTHTRARLDMVLSLLAHGRKERAQRLLVGVDPRTADERRDARTAALLLDLVPAPAVAIAARAPRGAERGLERAWLDAQEAFEVGDAARAVARLDTLPLPARTLRGPDAHFRYARALAESAREPPEHKRAAVELETLIRREPLYAQGNPALYYWLARALDHARSFDKAVRNMRAYAAKEPAELTLGAASTP